MGVEEALKLAEIIAEHGRKNCVDTLCEKLSAAGFGYVFSVGTPPEDGGFSALYPKITVTASA
jgi:hypothetical protein